MRTPRRRRDVGRLACAPAVALALAAGAAGCAADPAARPSPHEVRYDLAWSEAGITRRKGAAEWTVENDLGYRIRVERGWVVTRGVELVECPRQARAAAAIAIDALAAAIAPRAAWAGHSSAAPNPAAITTPIVEPLAAPETIVAGAVTLPPQDYCRVFYLVARASNASRALPEEVDMADRSLHVAGTYWQPGATEGRPFAITTAIANGKTTDLFPPGRFGRAADALRMSSGRTGARVVIRRRLDTLFDGVDLAHTSERDAGRRILTNLVAAAEIEIDLRPEP